MKRDTRFPRPDRQDLESKLPPDTFNHPQSFGVWSLFLQCDDPSEVSHRFRSYRDSPYCSVPKESLRAMRDTLIDGMREANKKLKKPLVEKRKGTHYDVIDEWYRPQRNGA